MRNKSHLYKYGFIYLYKLSTSDIFCLIQFQMDSEFKRNITKYKNAFTD